jgi:hypothetical protein
MPLSFFSAPARLVLAVALVVAAAPLTACTAADDGASVAEDDVKTGVRLDPIESSPELAGALAQASEASGTSLSVATFRYDAAKVKDAGRVVSALRAKLEHPRLRQDEGAASEAVLKATLDEYGVTEAPDVDAIATALRAAVGAEPVSKKLWLRSDDVANADSEWAEVVLLYVTPDKGTAIRLTIRYEA